MRTAPGGVGQYFDGQNRAGRLVEVYASTCAHCGYITEFPSLRTMHEHIDICRGCMRPICLRCAGKPCRPQEKEAERLEREHRIHGRIVRAGWNCY